MTKARVYLFLLCALTAAPALAQPIMIKFANNAELGTVLTEVTDEYLNTEAGPYHFSDIQRLTFQMNLPDSITVERLKSKGVEIYLRTKRITPTTFKPVAPPPTPAKPEVDTVKKAPSEQPSASPKAAPWQPSPRGYHASTAGGLGLGLDYGGIGIKLTLGATSAVSVFGGLGYNLNKVGYNAGLEFNFTPKEKSTGFLSAMYGYNAVLLEQSGGFNSSETFYGPSFGFGVKSRSKSSENFFTIQIIYPIRDKEFMNASAEKPWPVLFSLGYHFGE